RPLPPGTVRCGHRRHRRGAAVARRQQGLRGTLRARVPHPCRRAQRHRDPRGAAPAPRERPRHRTPYRRRAVTPDRRPSTAAGADMTSHITTHVLDTVLGRPAAGIRVGLARQTDDRTEPIATGTTDADGRCRDLGPESLEPGTYRLVFA